MHKLKPNLDLIRELITKHDTDSILVVCGVERVGKSSLALQMAQYIDPLFTVDQVVFDVENMYKQVYSLKPGQVLILDEAANAFFSRTSMSKDQVEGVKLLTVMGERNLCVIMCIPSFFILDRYIREHRISSLIKVVARGKMKFYSRKRIKQSFYNPKANAFNWANCNFVDRFNKFSGPLWEKYKKKKAEYLSARRSDWTETNKESRYITLAEAAKKLEVKYGTLFKWHKEGKLESKKSTTGRLMISQDEYKRLLALSELNL